MEGHVLNDKYKTNFVDSRKLQDSVRDRFNSYSNLCLLSREIGRLCQIGKLDHSA